MLLDTPTAVTRPLDELPNYQIARLFVEFFASVDEHLGVMFPNRLAEANIFQVIARASLTDWVREDSIAPPDTNAQAKIRSYAIAMSLSRSPETLRRHTDWLIDHGYLVGSRTGLSVSPAPANVERTVTFYQKLHDLFLRFVADVSATTDYSPDMLPRGRPSVADILSRTMDAMLATLEPGSTIPDDPITDSMFCLINALNVRDITHDAEQARRYAEISVPDDRRTPVSLKTVAKVLQLPYATLWRRARELERMGLLRRQQRGWIVPHDILAVEAIQTSFNRHVGFFVRKMRELERLGLTSGDGAPAYLVGRPPLAGEDMSRY